MKYYDWDVHEWITIDGKHTSTVDNEKLERYRKENHDISEYPDEYNPYIYCFKKYLEEKKR